MNSKTQWTLLMLAAILIGVSVELAFATHGESSTAVQQQQGTAAAVPEPEEHGLSAKAIEIARPFNFPITNSTGKESRTIVLGHLLRGGSPTSRDRNLGVSFGAGAVYGLAKGMDAVMVALKLPPLEFVPLG